MERRRRRSFTDEFKAKAVQLARSSGKSMTAVATDLDLTVSSLRSWMMQAEVDAGGGKASVGDLRDDVDLLALAEVGVAALEIRVVALHDEELAPVGVGTGVRHRERTRAHLEPRHLVLELVAGPAAPAALRVPALDHERGDHAMEREAVEELLLHGRDR